jgi:GNAT superfamily N-acetyltransferase
VLEEQLLNPKQHHRQAFCSGVAALDEYLQHYAVQQSKRGVTSVRVLVETVEPAAILGYYTLSAAEVQVSVLSPAAQKKLPRYPVPCFRMGRLAIHRDRQKQGLGAILLGCAVERCLHAKQQVAAYALLVDAKDEAAKAFYEHYGFIACPQRPLTLYLPLGQ